VANYDPSTGISGSTFVDSSGNGYHAQLFGSPTTTVLNGYTVLRLNGINQYYYNTAGFSSSMLGGSVTYDVWFRTSSASTTQTLLSEYGKIGLVANGWRDAILGLTSSKMSGGVYNGFVPSRSGYLANTWYNLVVTYASGVIRLYVNGVNQGSLNRTRITTPSVLYYAIGYPDFNGMFLGGVKNYFNGYVGPVKFYSVALTQSEITQNFIALRWRYGGPTVKPVTKPSGKPSLKPTTSPTNKPTTEPTNHPASSNPSSKPTIIPTPFPT
jgi:hypothetical protein